MDKVKVLMFLNDYGLIIVFALVFLEYLNLPGFPSGIILPTIGFWARTSKVSIALTILISLVAGVLGSLILYYVGLFGGRPLLERIYIKFPKARKNLLAFDEKMKNNENITILLSRLIPVIRTLAGFPAGARKMNIINYIIYSGLGIFIWNMFLIGSGYILSSFTVN